MTTTEPTATAVWVDSLVPAEQREEGHRLLAEVEALRDQITPLLNSIGSALADHEIACREADHQVEAVAGRDAAIAVGDGLSEMIGKLNGATALHAALSDMGIDPDALMHTAEHQRTEHDR